jgi:DNA end-binding protein Ku
MGSKSTGSGTISFGLVAIPCKIYVANSSESVSFNQITPAGNRTKQKIVDSVSGEEVTHDQLRKGYEHTKSQYVVFTPEELKSLEPSSSSSIELIEMVDASSVDLTQVEKSHYLGPDKGGDKAYALLSQTLEKTGKMGVAKWCSRGKEHLVLIRSYRHGLIIHQMYYQNEVRDFEEIRGGTSATFHDLEIEAASSLVSKLSTGAFDPSKYTDTYSERVLKAVEDKVAGKDITIVSESPKAQIVDLMEALKMSLSDLEKKAPAQAATVQVATDAAPKKAGKKSKSAPAQT